MDLTTLRVPPARLVTERLILRPWEERDLAPFAALNADPEVMRFFVAPLTRPESDAVVGRLMTLYDTHGFTFFAVEERATGDFVGFTGVIVQTMPAHFTPALETGWRLAKRFWGKGYATEAAIASRDFAASLPGARELVAMAVPINRPSLAVMDRIGLVRDPDADFDHPKVPEGHPLRRHVLYRLRFGPPS